MQHHSPLIYGTAWKEADTQRCVRDALRAGFRAIDTANQRKHYFEEGVGKAIRESIDGGLVTRGELFLQTKFTFRAGQDERLPYNSDTTIEKQVDQSFQSSLEHLQTDYVDSLVLHGPSRREGLGDADWMAWGGMEAFATDGGARALGVSNVGLDQLKLLYEAANIKPAFVQNRCFAATGWDRDIRLFCSEKGIVYQGFSLLTANQQIFGHLMFRPLMEKYQTTPAQLVFRFAKQVGMWPLTGTTNPDHMREDLDACDGDAISAEDLKAMEAAFTA